MIGILIGLGYLLVAFVAGGVGFVVSRTKSEFERLMREYRQTVSRAAQAAREGQDGLAELLTEQADRLLEAIKKFGGSP